MKVSVIFVHYRTPELAARAVRSVRAEAAAVAGLAAALEILLVDNGSDAAGRELLAALPARLLEPGENLGFAGGVNLGAAQAAGEVLLLANPDLELLPGCLPALLAALDAGAAAAGPRFYWDRERRFLLPPGERRDRVSELAARLARRGPEWARRARRRWRRHARRHWRAETALTSRHLSGALLAVSRAAWQRVGPFDDGYRLYFEETDWLLRLQRAGLRAVHEPRAEAVHHYNRSAGGEPRAAQWYAESARRFAARWYGTAFRRLADAVERRGVVVQSGEVVQSGGETPFPPPLAGTPAPPTLELPAARRPLWIELSPSPVGLPAAAERLPVGVTRWSLPEALWERMDAGRWSLRVVDDRGRELAAASFERPESEPPRRAEKPEGNR